MNSAGLGCFVDRGDEGIRCGLGQSLIRADRHGSELLELILHRGECATADECAALGLAGALGGGFGIGHEWCFGKKERKTSGRTQPVKGDANLPLASEKTRSYFPRSQN